MNYAKTSGYDDWRLPTLKLNDATCSSPNPPVFSGTHCTGGELSGLFVTDLGNKPDEWHAVAVRPGDVAAVPEPQTGLLLLLGLGVMTRAGQWRRRAPNA